MIEARGVALAYGETAVLDDVTLDVRRGELLVIIGPNGAGKSTLLRALAGLHVARSGVIRVDGEPVETMRAQDRARHVALVEVEGPSVEGVSVGETVALGRMPYRPWWRWAQLPEDAAIVDAALERSGLSSYANRPLDSLSSGERQRVWIALAVAQQAPNLLFDEPTSHLDLQHATRMLSLLRSLADDGAAVAIVVHDLNLAAAHADRIALLGAGRLLACDVPERVFVEGLLSEAYGTAIVVRNIDGMLLATAAAPAPRRLLL